MTKKNLSGLVLIGQICMAVLQNHEDDYNYWQRHQAAASDLGLNNVGDNNPERSVLMDTSGQDQASFNDIYTYDPASLDDYELDLPDQKSYQLK